LGCSLIFLWFVGMFDGVKDQGDGGGMATMDSYGDGDGRQARLEFIG
jgi:hypothetical protein